MKKLLALTLAMAVAAALFACALSESVTGYVKSGTLKVYASPKTSARVLATMYKGQTVSVVACRSGWCQLESPAGRIGYCKADSLSKTDINSGKCWIISDTACLVHTASGKEVRVTYGQCFDYVKTEGSKTYIQNRAGEIGYIDTELVTRSNPFNLNTPVYTQVSGPLLQKTAFGKSSAVSVPQNTRLTLVSVSPEQFWDAVLYNDKLYYVHHKLLDAEKAPPQGAVYVMEFDAAITDKPSWSSAKVIGRVKAGDLVRLTGYVKGYGAKILTLDASNGLSGYIMALPIVKK